MRTNLLEETINDIRNAELSIDNIIFIGSSDGEYECTWQEFKLLADAEYDSGYGGQEVMQDIIIIFADGSKMLRGEYDGSEWWDIHKPLVKRVDCKKLTSLFPAYSWETIAENEERLRKGEEY